MNITEETNDYFSTTEKLKVEKTQNGIFSFSRSNIIKGESMKEDCLSELHDVIITDLKDGDILDECNNGVYINKEHKHESYFIDYMENHLNTGSWNDQQVWNNLKDKLKATPDRGIKKISKVFRVNWSKVFKREWLLWK